MALLSLWVSLGSGRLVCESESAHLGSPELRSTPVLFAVRLRFGDQWHQLGQAILLLQRAGGLDIRLGAQASNWR